MMMQDRNFTDEELTAFLDGEDDLAPVAEIELALKSDAALEQRVEALRIDIQTIIDCFQNMHPNEDAIPDFSAM